jgi:hypothetical protein
MVAKRISASPRRCQGAGDEKAVPNVGKQVQNANDHEQQARVHSALPFYSVVILAPELVKAAMAPSQLNGAGFGLVCKEHAAPGR